MFFNENGILARPLWKLNHQLKYLNKFPKMKLEVSEKLEKSILNIPSSSNLIV